MTLQHQRHHIVLSRKDLTELLSQASCFLQAPVASRHTELSGPVPSITTSHFSITIRSVSEVQDLGLGARRSGAPESSGYASKGVASWVGITE